MSLIISRNNDNSYDLYFESIHDSMTVDSLEKVCGVIVGEVLSQSEERFRVEVRSEDEEIEFLREKDGIHVSAYHSHDNQMRDFSNDDNEDFHEYITEVLEYFMSMATEISVNFSVDVF